MQLPPTTRISLLALTAVALWPALAASQPTAPPDTAARLVELARTAADEERHDRAGEHFRTAAALAPELARWLRLSALQHAARAGDTASARPAAERLRADPVVWDDSVAVERARAAFEAGDRARGREAARRLDGDEDPDLWVRHAGPAFLAAGDTTRARRGYLAAAAAPGAPAEAGRTLVRLGTDWEGLAAVARADLDEGRGARGRDFLGRALDAAPRGDAPELALRLVEAHLDAGLEARAHETAAAWLGRDGLNGEDRARMELLAARSHLRRGQREAGEVHFRRAMNASNGESSARAAYRLADMAHGRGLRSAARERYREAAERFPDTRLGGQARMRLGFMELADGRPGAALEHFRSYRLRRPRGSWGHAALYWEGRARLDAGDSAQGDELLERAVRRDPVSYYAHLAARRLGTDPIDGVVARSAPGEDGRADGGTGDDGGRTAADPGDRPGGGGSADRVVGALLERMNGLRGLGWPDRAARELDAARREAVDAAGGPLAFARRLHGAGWPGRGIGMGWSAFDRAGGVWSRPLMEAVYPLPHREALTRAAAREGLPPALMAAVIRQESAFDHRAISPAGAVGLMQLMPGTAAEMAVDLRPQLVDEEALTDPALSLELGARYMAEMLERFDGSWIAALVSYNAGPHRYQRWRTFPEFGDDRELTVERIPFGETRRYVKAVLRNVRVYRRLHDLPGGDVRTAE